MSRIAPKLTATEGMEIAEAALVFPVLFMLLLGIVWFGRAFQVYATMSQAAQQGVALAARPVCATCTPGTGTWTGTSFPGDGAVENAILATTDAARLDRSQMTPATLTVSACTAPPAPPGGGCSTSPGGYFTICRAVQLNPASTPQQCGTVVGFEYAFQFNLPFTSLNMRPITLKAQAQSRMEN